MIYSTVVAARILGVTRQTVWNWLNDGTLDEVPSQGKARLVSGASVETLRVKRESAA